MKTFLRLLVLLLAVAASPAPTLAQQAAPAAQTGTGEAPPPPDRPVVTIENADQLFPKWERDAAAVEQRLQSEAITTDVLSSIREVLDPQRINARALAAQAKGQLAPLTAQIEALGQSDDRVDDRDISSVFQHARHEASVDLQLVDVEQVQARQRRRRLAEVVERERHARRPDPLGRFDDEVSARRDVVLDHFEREPRRIEPGGQQERLEHADEHFALDVAQRDVD